MLEIIMLTALLILIVFNTYMYIWYRTEIKYLENVRKRFEKLSEEYEAELAEKHSEDTK